MDNKLLIETAAGGRFLVIGETNECKAIVLTRDQAIELMERLPGMINEMPVKIEE